MRALARHIADHPLLNRIIIALIVINAVILGLETYPGIMASIGPWLVLADHIILAVFVAELAVRLLAHGMAFWRDPWNVFDFAIVGVSLLPANEAYSVLRALRVLRVLRLISAFASLRRVVQGLFAAIPGIASIGAIMVIIFYVFAVMATKLFGASHAEWFGTLSASLFSLFQIMTLEGWADMVRDIMAVHPWAWIFFFIYIIASTFTVLNLFIAVIVEAMSRQATATTTAATTAAVQALDAEQDADFKAVQAELRAIRQLLEKREKQG
jgi:voltage-gated sodium channel